MTAPDVAACLDRLAAADDVDAELVACIADTHEPIAGALRDARGIVGLGGAVAVARRLEVGASPVLAAAGAWLSARGLDRAGLRYASGPMAGRPLPQWRAPIHGGPVVGLALLDCTAVLSLGRDELVELDPSDGRLRHALEFDFTASTLAVSPSGQQVALGADVDDDVVVIDRGYAQMRIVDSPRSTRALVWIGDGELAVVDGHVSLWTVDDDGAARRWSVDRESRGTELPLTEGYGRDGEVMVLRVDLGGHAFLDRCRGGDGTVVDSTALEFVFPDVERRGILVPSPSGTACAWVDALGGGVVVFDTSDGHTRSQTAGNGGGVEAVTWLDESRLLVGRATGGVDLVDAASGLVLASLSGHDAAISALLPVADGVLAGDASGRVAHWRLDAWTSHPAESTDRATFVDGVHDDAIVAIGEELRRIDRGASVRWRVAEPPGTVAGLHQAGDRTLVVTSRQPDPNAVEYLVGIHRLDVATGVLTTIGETRGMLTAVAVSPRGDLVLAMVPGTGSTLVRVHEDGLTEHALGAGAQLQCLAFVGDTIIAGTSRGELKALNAELDAITTTTPAHAKSVAGLFVGGDTLVSLGLDGKGIVWDWPARTARRTFEFSVHPRRREGPLSWVALAGGARIALSFRQPLVEIVDVDGSGKPARVELPSPVVTMAGAPQGRWFAVGSEDGRVFAIDPSGNVLGVWAFEAKVRQLSARDLGTLFVRTAAGVVHTLRLDPPQG